MEAMVSNFSGMGIDAGPIKKIAKRLGRKKWIVDISLVRKAKIEQLNTKYRKKNKPTDVLSFLMKEGRLLGDVIICPSVAKANAKRSGTSLKQEIARLAAHGMLHLLGYKHGRKMFDRQERMATNA